MRWAVLLLGVAGCDLVLALDEPAPASRRDASAPPIDSAAPPVDVMPDASPLVFCPSSYSLVGPTGARYRHNTSTASWVTASDDCADDSPGTQGVYTHLAVFATEAERVAVNAMLPTTLHVGLSARVNPGQWIWVTLELTDAYPPVYPPITSPPWTSGQPNIGACGAVDETGGFESRDCVRSNPVPYLCECDTWPDVPSRH